MGEHELQLATELQTRFVTGFSRIAQQVYLELGSGSVFFPDAESSVADDEADEELGRGQNEFASTSSWTALEGSNRRMHGLALSLKTPFR